MARKKARNNRSQNPIKSRAKDQQTKPQPEQSVENVQSVQGDESGPEIPPEASAAERTAIINKWKVLRALESEECCGLVKAAVQSAGISLSVFYKYYKADKDFAADVDAARVAGGYHIESKMLELINGIEVIHPLSGKAYKRPPSWQMIQFALSSEKFADIGYTPLSKQKKDVSLSGSSGFAILEVPDNGRSLKGLEPPLPQEVLQAIETDGSNITE